jgi:hypothetical protein
MLPRDNIGLPITRAMENIIIEAASASIQNVILAIAPDPPDVDLNPRQVPFNQLWADKYQAIEDLHVISPVAPIKYLESDLVHQARWPWVGFVFEEEVLNPEETAEELYTGILGAIIGTNQTMFPESQKEMMEIHHDVRSILYSDKQLSKMRLWGTSVTHKGNPDPIIPGGIIENLRFHSFESPIYQRPNEMNPELDSPFLVIQFNYQIWYREAVIH